MHIYVRVCVCVCVCVYVYNCTSAAVLMLMLYVSSYQCYTCVRIPMLHMCPHTNATHVSAYCRTRRCQAARWRLYFSFILFFYIYIYIQVSSCWVAPEPEPDPSELVPKTAHSCQIGLRQVLSLLALQVQKYKY